MSYLPSISDIVGPGRGLADTSVSEPLRLTLPTDQSILKDTPVRITVDGKFAQCSVDSYENSSVAGIAIANSSGGNLTAVVLGIDSITISHSFSNGDAVYLSVTGGLTNIAPSISGQWVCRIGKYYTNNQIKIIPEEPFEVLS